MIKVRPSLNSGVLGILVVLAMALQSTGSSSLAAAPSRKKQSGANQQWMAAGAQAYKAGQYEKALGIFSSLMSRSPNDQTAHYYMALCYQQLNQMSLAREQYQWVSQCGTGTLQNQADYALQSLSRHAALDQQANQDRAAIAEAAASSTPPPRPAFKAGSSFTHPPHVSLSDPPKPHTWKIGDPNVHVIKNAKEAAYFTPRARALRMGFN